MSRKVWIRSLGNMMIRLPTEPSGKETPALSPYKRSEEIAARSFDACLEKQATAAWKNMTVLTGKESKPWVFSKKKTASEMDGL
jgi:hypothetical protein